MLGYEPDASSIVDRAIAATPDAPLSRDEILSDIELIRIQDIDGAYERMLKADVKYRFVIDMASLREEAAA